MAVIGIDAGHARDIMLMLADAHALISDPADGPPRAIFLIPAAAPALTSAPPAGAAPAAARQAAAVLRDADSPYTLDSLASALAETVNWLSAANSDSLSHIPG